MTVNSKFLQHLSKNFWITKNKNSRTFKTAENKHRKKTRKCLEWKFEEMTGKIKCIKLFYLKNSNKSEQKNVIQRINSGVSTRSGFVIPLQLDLVEKVGPKRTRKCLEWKLVAMTGKLICIKMSFLK